MLKIVDKRTQKGCKRRNRSKLILIFLENLFIYIGTAEADKDFVKRAIPMSCSLDRIILKTCEFADKCPTLEKIEALLNCLSRIILWCTVALIINRKAWFIFP